MATDLFQARGINVDQPRDLFSERGINPEQDLMFNPANETSTGTFVPPGTYDQPYARAASHAILNMMTGGIPSLATRAATSGAINALLGATDTQSPVKSAYQGGMEGLLAGVAPEAFNLAKKGYNAVSQSINPPQVTMPNELMPTKEGYSPYKQQFQFGGEMPPFGKVNTSTFIPPSFLTEQPQIASPEEHAAGLMQSISKGQTPEQAGQALSQHVQNTFMPIKTAGQEKYNTLFDTQTYKDLFYPEGDTIQTVRDAQLYPNVKKPSGEYINVVGKSKTPYGDSNLDELHQQLLQDPNVNNGHFMQSELGNEIGYLQKQKQAGNLDNTGKNQLRFYIKAQKSLQNQTRSIIDDAIPGGGKAYDEATQNWKDNVIPYTSDSVLRQMINGELDNPTTAQVNSTFKNPEGGISKVVSDLGQQGKDNIAYIGMGKLPEENAPNQLISGNKSLQKKGLGSYLSPEHQQSFGELNQKIENVKNTAEQQQQNKGLLDILRQQYERPQNAMLGMPSAETKAQANAIMKSGLEKQNAELAKGNALTKIGKVVKKLPFLEGFTIGKFF